jgi:glycosyltransferase involved in cell wall biosynthesis
MRILLACSQYPPMKTGYAMIAYQLNKEFSKLGHTVDTITEGAGCHRRGKIALLDDGGKRMFESLPDIVQIIGPTPLFSEQCIDYAKKTHLPVVYQMNAFPGLSSYYHTPTAGIIDSLYKKLYFHRKIRRADLLIFQTHEFAEYFTTFYDGPFEVIPHGLDLEEINEPDGHFENTRSNASRVLFVGQLRRYKGLPYLIKSVKQLRDEGRNIVLDIVGGGPDHDRIEELVSKLGLQSSVFLRGEYSREQLGPIYRRSQVFVLPSIEGESFGIVLLEAGARGVPVIASDFPGVREVVESLGGTVVPPRDSGALAKAIANTLDINLLRPTRTIPVGIARFLWENIARTYLKSYGKILGITSEKELFPSEFSKQLEKAELA